jgi:hypothetical protein
MDTSKPILVLEESLLGRATVEGPGQLLWLITTPSMIIGLKWGILLVGFVGLWHWQINGAFAVYEMSITLLAAMCMGVLMGIVSVFAGRQLWIYRNHIVLSDRRTEDQKTWLWNELASVRILDGPKKWTTLELEVASQYPLTIRFVAKCSKIERELMRNVIPYVKIHPMTPSTDCSLSNDR